MAVRIPPEHLSEEALRGLVEAYIGREGTDYGSREVPMERKVAQVMAQLRDGRAVITWDIETSSASIVPAEDLGDG
ncbi:MAG: YheU family protein [Pseudomonadales bacterium]|nr:YheU family protein [Pseudomonadales bacterium]